MNISQKINLLIYSPVSGTIGELDFRISTCYDRWQLGTNLPSVKPFVTMNHEQVLELMNTSAWTPTDPDGE